MARILVVGSGDVGGTLARNLAAKDHEVFGLRRSDKPVGEGVTTISADVGDMETLIGQIPEDLDYVFYSVASPDFSEEGYELFYVQGMTHILALLKQQHNQPKRIFFVSSSSVYHHHDGSWVDENTEPEPTAFAGKKMFAAETKLHESGFANTVVRFSGIYGPGRTRLINQALHGSHCDPEPPLWTNRIHRDDCVGVLEFLLEKAESGKALEDLYVASDPTPAPLFDVLEWIKDRVGEVDPDHDIPEAAKRGNKRISSKKLQDLGYKFKYKDFQQGYEEILTDMGY